MASNICERKFPLSAINFLIKSSILNKESPPPFPIFFFLISGCYSTNVAIQLDTLIIGTILKNTNKRLHEKFITKFT